MVAISVSALVAVLFLFESASSAPVLERRQDIDFSALSKTISTGAQAIAQAGIICPASLNENALDAKRRDALDFLDSAVNPGIRQSNGAEKNALKCQKNIVQVLKNTCQLEFAKKRGIQGQIRVNTAQVPNNAANVDKNCVGVNK
ncbi:hypothetical protein HDU67_005235, partial [Dinochytrium kinnereticum]